jgi:CheY-like chemotaxis protein
MKERRILIVEDEMDLCYLVKEYLRDAGYNVTIASNGREALEKLRKINVDLVLLDIILPIMDGWNVVEKIKKSKKLRNIPIIIFTAKPEDKRDRAYLQNYKLPVIKKPFEWSQLIKKITTYISKGGGVAST